MSSSVVSSKTMATKTEKRQFLFKVLCVFLSLTLAFVIALIVWMVNGGPEESTTHPLFQNSGSDTLEMLEDICLVEQLVGDGYCDDEANHSGCDFDLDDCCQLESDRNQCTNCTCWVSSEQREVIIEDSCYGMNVMGYLGDGICNLNYNQKEYFFDIGDCCQSSSPWPLSCRFQYEPNECPDNPCIPSNNYCIPQELGDGICQDHNNGPYCDYDFGDCCLNNYDQLDQCCSCACHM